MLRTIVEASENFCIHQIRLAHIVDDKINDKKRIIAYIDIETQYAERYRVYLAFEPNFIQMISKVFLEEDDSDEETLIDMALESVNLIVGSAKVIAERTGINPFTIATPNFIKIDSFNLEYDEAKIIKINNDEMIVAIKEL